MAAVHGTINRKPGQIFANDHVQWFDPSTFELRHGIATGCLHDTVEIKDDDGLSHIVPVGHVRLWCLAGQPRPVSTETAQAITERLLALEATVYSKPKAERPATTIADAYQRWAERQTVTSTTAAITPCDIPHTVQA